MKKILYIFLILIGCQESKNNDWFQRLLGTWKSPSRSITFFEDGTFVDSVFSGQDILSIVSGEFSINERNIVTIDSGIFLVNNVSELSGLQYRSMQVELADDSPMLFPLTSSNQILHLTLFPASGTCVI